MRIVLVAAAVVAVNAWLWLSMSSSPTSTTPRPKREWVEPSGPLATLAEDTTPGPAATADAALPRDAVDWAPSLGAAVESARASGRLVFAYIALPPRDCPACELLERTVFARPEAAALGKRYVAVRVRLVDDPDPRARALVSVLRIGWAPHFVALAGDGDVVTQDFGPRLPYMAKTGEALPDSASDAPTAERLLERMAAAERAEAADRAALAATEGKEDAGSLRDRASLLDRRQRLPEAVETWRALARLEPDGDAAERVVSLFVRQGDLAKAVAELDAMRERRPDDPRRADWLVKAALLRHGVVGAAGQLPKEGLDELAASLQRLIEEAHAAGRVRAEGVARVVLARVLADGGDAVAVPDLLRWFDAHDDVRWCASVRSAVGSAAMSHGDPRAALRQFELIAKEFPDSAAADWARHGLLDQLRGATRISRN